MSSSPSVGEARTNGNTNVQKPLVQKFKQSNKITGTKQNKPSVKNSERKLSN